MADFTQMLTSMLVLSGLVVSTLLEVMCICCIMLGGHTHPSHNMCVNTKCNRKCKVLISESMVPIYFLKTLTVTA